jgi:hypothetical protein
MGKTINAHITLEGNILKTAHCEYLVGDRRVILRWILGRHVVRMGVAEIV